MDPAKIRDLLERVRSGDASIDEAQDALKHLPFADLGYAMVDHHRALRQGVPEVILGEGKTSEQIAGIAQELARTGQNVLVTRLDEAKAKDVLPQIRGMRYAALARTATLEQAPIPPLGSAPVALVSAGTSDLPVAEECAETMRMLGVAAERVYDVGVAGIHRLLAHTETLVAADAVVVVAGMEGALASVVGGLTAAPVVAVPTSAGYGAAFGGVTALLAMLSSCAQGVAVVGIDNGFGAACAVTRVCNQRAGRA